VGVGAVRLAARHFVLVPHLLLCALLLHQAGVGQAPATTSALPPLVDHPLHRPVRVSSSLIQHFHDTRPTNTDDISSPTLAAANVGPCVVHVSRRCQLLMLAHLLPAR